jgi:integrase
MRLGEILNLRWSNVLWMDRIIRLEDSKNNEPREIPFSGGLETVLREQFAKRQEGCDRVCFRLDTRGHARSIGNFRKPWRRACVKIGAGSMEPVRDAEGRRVFDKPRYPRSKPKPKMVYTGLIFHDLRRTFITDAEHSGAPRHEVMKISGHKTEAVYKRYAIENREQRRAALAQIDDYRAKKFGDNSGTIEESSKQENTATH